MLSKRFFAWVGVGVLSVATIPTLAAPQLARLAQRKPAPASKAAVTKSTTATSKAVPSKAGTVKTTAVAHKSGALPGKKKSATHTATKLTTSTKTPGRLHETHRVHAANKTTTLTHKPTTLAHKPTTLTHKPAAAPATHKQLSTLAHKPTPSATAKKLLH